jgi:hypothetical protein
MKTSIVPINYRLYENAAASTVENHGAEKQTDYYINYTIARRDSLFTTLF